MLICASEHSGFFRCLFVEMSIKKRVVHTHTMETKQNKTDLRDLLSGDRSFIFPALNQSHE